MRDLRTWARARAAIGIGAACGTSEEAELPPTRDVELPVLSEAPAEVPARAEPGQPSSGVMQPNGPPRVPPTEPPPASGARSGFGGSCNLSSDCEPGLLFCFGSPGDASA